jgi:hypothetical protein
MTQVRFTHDCLENNNAGYTGAKTKQAWPVERADYLPFAKPRRILLAWKEGAEKYRAG